MKKKDFSCKKLPALQIAKEGKGKEKGEGKGRKRKKRRKEKEKEKGKGKRKHRKFYVRKLKKAEKSCREQVRNLLRDCKAEKMTGPIFRF